MHAALNSAMLVWRHFTLSRYLVASIIAFVADTATFFLLLQMRVNISLASAIAYLLGVAVHWYISTHIVFPDKVKGGVTKQVQGLLFLGSAFLGLGITVAVITEMVAMGISPAIAKGCAVILSFGAVYAIRKWGIFR